MGVDTVGDLAALDPQAVIGALGRAHGQHLVDLANGRDERAVEPEREAKSIGHEETFAHDLHDLDDVRREIIRLADAVASRLRAHGIGARTLTLKVRDGGFVDDHPGDDAGRRGRHRRRHPARRRAAARAHRPRRRRPPARCVGVQVRRAGRAAAVRRPGVRRTRDVDPAGRARPRRAGGPLARRQPGDRRRPGALRGGRHRSGEQRGGRCRRPPAVRVVRPGAQQWGPDHDGTGRRIHPPR